MSSRDSRSRGGRPSGACVGNGEDRGPWEVPREDHALAAFRLRNLRPVRASCQRKAIQDSVKTLSMTVHSNLG